MLHHAVIVALIVFVEEAVGVFGVRLRRVLDGDALHFRHLQNSHGSMDCGT
jgi:hypothetical protein